MTERHTPADDLAGYVTGALGAARARAVEAHCASCAPCGEALRREARFEMALHEVADRARAAAPLRPLAPVLTLRAAGVGVVALAAAAAALLMLNVSSASRGDDAPQATHARAATAQPACGDGAPCGVALASRGVDASWQAD